jgi:hypothetical protein
MARNEQRQHFRRVLRVPLPVGRTIFLLLFSALAGPHPRSLSPLDIARDDPEFVEGSLAQSRSSFGKLRTTLSYVEGSLGPQALFPDHQTRATN